MHLVNYCVSVHVEDTFCLIEAVGGQSFLTILVTVWLEVLRNAEMQCCFLLLTSLISWQL